MCIGVLIIPNLTFRMLVTTLAFQKGCNCTRQRQARSAHCILIYDGRFPTLAGLSSFGREKIGPYNYPEREGKEEAEQTCVRYDELT